MATFPPVIDDDGSGTTGTVLDHAFFDQVKTYVDGAASDVVIASATTGTVHNWNVGPLAADTLIRWQGGADLIVSGLAGGSAGKTVTIKNVGTGVIYFSYFSSSSNLENRFDNVVTSGPTPIALRGSMTLCHNGSYWDMVGHEQGRAIRVVFNAAFYVMTGGGGTWTVDAGDVGAHDYYLSGDQLTVHLAISTSTIAGTVTNIATLGWPYAMAAVVPMMQGVCSPPSWQPVLVSPLATQYRIDVANFNGSAFGTATNGFYLMFTGTVSVT